MQHQLRRAIYRPILTVMTLARAAGWRTRCRRQGRNGRSTYVTWAACAVRPHASRPTERPVVIELSKYVFATLREDEELVLERGQGDRDLSAILVVAPVSEHPVPGILERLEHEYALRAELDSDWAARPLTLARREGRPMLILEDPGGEPLDRLLGRADGIRPVPALRRRPCSCARRAAPARSHPQGHQAGQCSGELRHWPSAG